MFSKINLSSFFRKPENKILLEDILSKTNFLVGDNISIRQRIWHYENNYAIPKCQCGREVKWSEKLRSYRKYCSQKCKATDPKWLANVANTNMIKYGVKTTLLEKNTKKKIQNKLIEKYGVTNPFASLEIQNKIKNKNLINFGFENPAKSQIIKDKITESHISKYGFERSCQSHIPEDIFNLINSKDELEERYLKSFSGNTLAEELKISPWLLFKQIHKLGIDIKPLKKSKEENLVFEFISSLGIQNIIVGDKTILHPQEIDIYLPDHNLGFEINGIYWHSESKGKTKYYHYNKSKKANEKGIKLVHFTDIDINNNFDKIKNKIKSLLGVNEKLYARKCITKNVPTTDEIEFLNKNHFQNYVPSKISLGLYYNDELISLMSFGKSRYNKNYQWELLRFCSKSGVSVIGGASKLFKKFIDQTQATNCISYCDLSRSFDNSFYSILNFIKLTVATPNYFYTNDYHNLQSRLKYQKHKLDKILPNYDKKLTEWQNMSNNGWDRYWDCGNSVWVWSI